MPVFFASKTIARMPDYRRAFRPGGTVFFTPVAAPVSSAMTMPACCFAARWNNAAPNVRSPKKGDHD